MTRAPVVPATAARDATRPLVLAVLVAAIVVFDPREGHPGGRPKYLVVVAGALAGAGLLLAAARHKPWRTNPLRWPLAALVAWTVVSTLASDHRETAVFGYTGSYDGLLTTAAFAVLFLAAAWAFTAASVPGAIRVVWFAAGTPVLVFGVAQLVDRLVTGDGGWDWGRPGISPWTIGSTLGNPNHLAGLLVILLPLAAVLAFSARGRTRLLVVAGTIVAVAELAVTASRGAWAGALAAATVLAILFRRELRPHRRRLLAGAAGTVALAAAVLAVLGPTGVTKLEPARLARTGPGTTLDLRFEVWAAAWRVTTDHPIVGVGPDVYPVVFPAYAGERFLLLYGPFTVANGAHNIFMNTLANLGAGGLATFLALLGAAGVHVRRRWRGLDGERRLVAGGLVAGLVAYLVQASLNTQTVALTLCFWVLLGLLVATTIEPGEGE